MTLVPGAAEAVARINRAGLLAIIATNQSGIARGLLTENDYRRVHARLLELLAQAGGRIDGDFFCPHLPGVSAPCRCRKPGTLLYEQAAERFGIDLSASWWIGDRFRDIEPATKLGGRGILVRTGKGESEIAAGARTEYPLADGVNQAVDLILGTVG